MASSLCRGSSMGSAELPTEHTGVVRTYLANHTDSH
jgi:hypothetical protein